MKLLVANIPDEYYNVMMKLVEIGLFKDKSDFIRQAIRNFFWDMVQQEIGADERVTLGNKMLYGDKELERYYAKKQDTLQTMRT